MGKLNITTVKALSNGLITVMVCLCNKIPSSGQFPDAIDTNLKKKR